MTEYIKRIRTHTPRAVGARGRHIRSKMTEAKLIPDEHSHSLFYRTFYMFMLCFDIYICFSSTCKSGGRHDRRIPSNKLLKGGGHDRRSRALIRLFPTYTLITFDYDVVPFKGLIGEYVSTQTLVIHQWAGGGGAALSCSATRSRFHAKQS